MKDKICACGEEHVTRKELQDLGYLGKGKFPIEDKKSNCCNKKINVKWEEKINDNYVGVIAKIYCSMCDKLCEST